MRKHRRQTQKGFTLLEVLIVIVIIGLLGGMTTTVIVSARRSVSNSLVSTQMAQLSIALDEYKNRFGEYPPDFSDPEAVMRHVHKRWPRYSCDSYADFLEDIRLGCLLSSQEWGRNDVADSSNGFGGSHWWSIRSHISALVFWLGGLPDKNGVPSGFYATPKYPLGVVNHSEPIARPGRAKRETPFFAFESKFMGAYQSDPFDAPVVGDDTNNWYYFPVDSEEAWDASKNAYLYVPAFCQGDYPIVYFKPTTRKPYDAKCFYLAEGATGGVISCAVPYSQLDGIPYEEKRFQLVHPGADGMFSADRGAVNPSAENLRCPVNGANLDIEDNDNLTNFVENGTIESIHE